MKLKSKFAVVTGASTGIGQAVAVEFAREGAFVALVARTEDRLSEIRKLRRQKQKQKVKKRSRKC